MTAKKYQDLQLNNSLLSIFILFLSQNGWYFILVWSLWILSLLTYWCLIVSRQNWFWGGFVSFFVHFTFFFSEACFFCLQLPFFPCKWNVSCLYKDAYDVYTVYIVSSLLYLSYKKWRWRRKSKLDRETFGGLPTVTLIAEERTDAGLFWTVILYMVCTVY